MNFPGKTLPVSFCLFVIVLVGLRAGSLPDGYIPFTPVGFLTALCKSSALYRQPPDLYDFVHGNSHSLLVPTNKQPIKCCHQQSIPDMAFYQSLYRQILVHTQPQG